MGADAGASGRDGPNGGTSGTNTGGVGGDGGAGDAGTGGADNTGGVGGEDDPGEPEPGIYGAVRLFVNDMPVCGGTLIANSWVLTADRCLPYDIDVSTLSVRFGMSSRNFHQQERAIEIERFPGNTAETRVRDVVLVGVGAPFEIKGSTAAHTIPLVPYGFPDVLRRQFRCVGWDFVPNPDSPTDDLKTAFLPSLGVVERDYGTAVRWPNLNPFDPLNGTLLTPTDAGSGCFAELGSSAYLATVHSENPSEGGDEEAYSIAVNAREIHEWLERTLVRVLPEAELGPVGNANVCSFGRESVDLFALESDGRMGWYRRSGATPSEWQSAEWADLPAIEPPDAIGLTADRPGVLCLADGSIELVARDVEDTVRRQHWSPDVQAWLPDWELVTEAGTVTSGVSIVGHAPGNFHAYARGVFGELRHGRYLGTWTGAWEDLGGTIAGAPSARMGNPAWIDAFVRGLDDSLFAFSSWDSASGWGYVGGTVSDPAVTTWAHDRVDVFVRDSANELGRYWYEHWWLYEPLRSGILLPPGELAAVTRETGSLDVFVQRSSGNLWHATYPRPPAP